MAEVQVSMQDVMGHGCGFAWRSFISSRSLVGVNFLPLYLLFSGVFVYLEYVIVVLLAGRTSLTEIDRQVSGKAL